MTLPDLQARILAWHERAFSWARPIDCLRKLDDECQEARLAALFETSNLADELADCLICVVAAAARAGVDLDAAVAHKLPRVMAKYPAEGT